MREDRAGEFEQLLKAGDRYGAKQLDVRSGGGGGPCLVSLGEAMAGNGWGL